MKRGWKCKHPTLEKFVLGCCTFASILFDPKSWRVYQRLYIYRSSNTFYKCTIYWNIRTIWTFFAFTETNQARHLFLRNFSRVPRLSSRVEYDRYCICVILAVFTRAPRGSISVQARYAWQESAVWSLTGQYGRYLPSSRRWRTGEWRFVAGGIWNGRWWIKQRFVYLTRCHPKSRLIVRPSAHGHGKARSHTLLRLI